MTKAANLAAAATNLTSTGTTNVSGINATGTPSSSTYLRGDGSWSSISAGLAGTFGQVFTSNGTFTIPAGVTALKVTVVGGGGGIGIPYCCAQHYGGTGGTSSVASGTQTISTISATGGAGASGGSGGDGGVGSGGDLNCNGGGNRSGSTSLAFGSTNGTGVKYGVGGYSPNYGSYGGGGGTGIKYLTGLTPGNTLSVTIGAAGGAGAANGNTIYSAATGVVVFEW